MATKGHGLLEDFHLHGIVEPFFRVNGDSIIAVILPLLPNLTHLGLKEPYYFRAFRIIDEGMGKGLPLFQRLRHIYIERPGVTDIVSSGLSYLNELL